MTKWALSQGCKDSSISTNQSMSDDARAETPLLCPPHVKSWLIGKDADAGRDLGQEEKGTTEGEMAGWHHWLNGRESEWTPGVGDGQGGLACCNSWGRKESDTTERLNWTDAPITIFLIVLGLFCVGLFLLLCFVPREVPLVFVTKLFLVVLNSLNFCLSGKLLISPSNLKESLAG